MATEIYFTWNGRKYVLVEPIAGPRKIRVVICAGYHAEILNPGYALWREASHAKADAERAAEAARNAEYDAAYKREAAADYANEHDCMREG